MTASVATGGLVPTIAGQPVTSTATAESVRVPEPQPVRPLEPSSRLIHAATPPAGSGPLPGILSLLAAPGPSVVQRAADADGPGGTSARRGQGGAGAPARSAPAAAAALPAAQRMTIGQTRRLGLGAPLGSRPVPTAHQSTGDIPPRAVLSAQAVPSGHQASEPATAAHRSTAEHTPAEPAVARVPSRAAAPVPTEAPALAGAADTPARALSHLVPLQRLAGSRPLATTVQQPAGGPGSPPLDAPLPDLAVARIASSSPAPGAPPGAAPGAPPGAAPNPPPFESGPEMAPEAAFADRPLVGMPAAQPQAALVHEVPATPSPAGAELPLVSRQAAPRRDSAPDHAAARPVDAATPRLQRTHANATGSAAEGRPAIRELVGAGGRRLAAGAPLPMPTASLSAATPAAAATSRLQPARAADVLAADAFRATGGRAPGPGPTSRPAGISVPASPVQRRATHDLPLSSRPAPAIGEIPTAEPAAAALFATPASSTVDAPPSQTPPAVQALHEGGLAAFAPPPSLAWGDEPVQRAWAGKAPGGSGAAAVDKEQELDDLAGKLYSRLRGRLAAELLLDRERAGLLMDFR